MSLPRGWLIALIFAELVAASALSCAAQAPAVPAQPAASSPSDQKPTINVPVPAQAQPQEPSASDQTTVERKTYTVPAGTKVLLELRSAINTKSAQPGDGVYLSSTFPVVVGNRVMIPNGVYVQGVVDHVVRGGRATKAQLDMHFTSIIFPNGSVVESPGMVDIPRRCSGGSAASATTDTISGRERRPRKESPSPAPPCTSGQADPAPPTDVGRRAASYR